MIVKGKITILINDDLKFGEKMQYGFIRVKGIEDDVFFNTLTSFEDVTFEELKIGDKVHVYVKQTDKGPLAESLTLSGRRSREKTYSPPPASL